MGTISTDTRELSILISEDNPANYFLMQKAMSEIRKESDVNLNLSNEQLLDFLLRESMNREPAAHHVPDLIIAAYSEPFCDLKIIADIRKKEQFANIPIIVLVNEDIRHTECKFIEYGVTKVLEKPSTYRGLKKAVQKIIAAYA